MQRRENCPPSTLSLTLLLHCLTLRICCFCSFLEIHYKLNKVGHCKNPSSMQGKVTNRYGKHEGILSNMQPGIRTKKTNHDTQIQLHRAILYQISYKVPLLASPWTIHAPLLTPSRRQQKVRTISNIVCNLVRISCISNCNGSSPSYFLRMFCSASHPHSLLFQVHGSVAATEAMKHDALQAPQKYGRCHPSADTIESRSGVVVLNFAHDRMVDKTLAHHVS